MVHNLTGHLGLFDNVDCATLYSEANMLGEKFELKDFDQSMDLKKDYRSEVQGWLYTGSAYVYPNCELTFCSGTYLKGNCRSIGEGYYDASVLSSISSANCTCFRECQCEDIFIPKHLHGRAYIDGDCDSCGSSYIKLYGPGIQDFPVKYKYVNKTFVLRKGCNLVIRPKTYGNATTLITTEISKNYHGEVSFYEIDCDDNAYVPYQRNLQIPFPPLIDLPATGDTLQDLAFVNSSIGSHPGVQAALQSYQNGRSPKNAYILYIGVGKPKFKCQPTANQIRECQFSVNMTSFGISNSQLRLIYFSVTQSVFDTINRNARWIATLDKYLMDHVELKNAIPNAVVIHHTVPGLGFAFESKLSLLNTLRGRLLDERYSNVVYLLQWNQDDPFPTVSFPENIVAQLESEIDENWAFPRPTFISLRNHIQLGDPLENGNWILQTNEYWPQSFIQKLVLACEKGGDAFGAEIVRTAFSGKSDLTQVFNKVVDLLPANHSLVNQYQKIEATREKPKLNLKLQQHATHLSTLNSLVNTQRGQCQVQYQELLTKFNNLVEDKDKTEMVLKNELEQLKNRMEDELKREIQILEAKFETEIQLRNVHLEQVEAKILEKIKQHLGELFA